MYIGGGMCGYFGGYGLYYPSGVEDIEIEEFF